MNSHKSQVYATLPLTYPDNGKSYAINFLLNTLGDVIWHYSFRSVLTPTQSDLSAQGCKISGSGDSMFTLILDVQS